MADTQTINVQLRDRVGKGAARAARREGLVPGVIYGDKKPPQPIMVARKELEKLIHTGHFFSTLYDVKAGAKAEKVLPRDVQFDVVKDFPIHVDLLRVAADAEVTIDVPVVFTDEDDCPGLRRGGVLNVVRHEIEVHCKATAMPEEIHASLKGLEIGDSLHISAIPLPDGVQPTIADRDFTVATIAPPTVAPAEEEEAAEAAAEAGEAEEAEAEAEAEAGEGEEAEE